MALTLICGRAGSGKTSFCLDAAAREMAADPLGRPILFIVPEQATFQIEWQLAAATERGAVARAHVLGFRRLAQRVLAETGGACRAQLTDLGKRLALRRLLVKHQGELQILGRAAKQRTFVETLVSAIWEFKTWRISPEQLDKLQEQLGSAQLAAKVHDLALLYKSFEEFLTGRYHDGEDLMTLLAEHLGQSKLVRGAQVYIDGFHWFSPQEYTVLASLLAVADVTVTLCIELPNGSAPVHDTELFHRQWTTWQELKSLARRLGVTVTEQGLPAGGRFGEAPLLAFIETNYFANSTPVYDGSAGGLTVAAAANRRAEVEGIARQLIRLSRDKGCRWREMAVLLRDSDSYSELLEMALAQHDIPFFTDRRRPAVQHPLAELIRSAVEAVTANWAYDPLFRCLKTDLFPIERGAIDILENYCLEFGIKGRRWTDDKPWTYVRRLSLDEDSEATAAEQLYLSEVNAVREAVRQPLVLFQREIKQAQTVTEQAGAVYNFLAALGVPEKLEAWAAMAEADGDLDQSREHHQLWIGVIGLLDQLVETCGDEEMTLEEFAAVLNEGLEGLTLSLIPPGLDYVTLSSLERSRTTAFKAVFIPGVNDGILPQRSREEGLLSDSERQLLADCGLELAPGAVADAFHEQFTVYTALTRASEMLWLSYSLADEEGKALAPSLVLDRLKRLGVLPELRQLPAEPPDGGEQEYIVHPQSALALLPAGLRTAVAAGSVQSVWWQLYNWAQAQHDYRTNLRQAAAGLFHRNQVEPLPDWIARQLYMKHGKLRGSVTRFEGYYSCPFQYFARYGLGLRDRAIFRLAAPDFGQFLHAVLKGFGDQLAAAGRQWRDVTAEEVMAYCREITAGLAPKLQNEILLSSRHYQHIQSRLEKTASRAVEQLTKFAAVSSFQPVALEQSFGRSGTDWPPLVFSLPTGEKVELAGQIDRIDKVVHQGQTYLLVVDYKSGQASLKLSDVVHGLKLQLILYLLAVCRVTGDDLDGAIPAGALYCFLKNPKVTGKRMLSDEEVADAMAKQLKMPGWVLAEPAIVSLLDNGIDGWSDYMKVWLKNGNFRSNNNSLKTAEQFALLMGHAKQTVVGAAQEIISGQAAIAPYNIKNRTPCTYCLYRSVCQFDCLLPENEYRMLPELTEAEAWNVLQGGKGENE